MSVLNFIDFRAVNPQIVDFLPIRWYGLLFATGFLLGFYILRKIFRNDVENIEVADKWMDKILVYVLIATVVGARLGHVFFYDWNTWYKDHPEDIFKIWEGGLASHGAAIGIIIAVYFYSKIITKKSMLWTFDRLVIVVALGMVFIRFGNLMNHEIVGVPTDKPWAFLFRGYDEPRHPAQLYEAMLYLITFATLYLSYWKTAIKDKPGFLFGIFLTIVFVSRFIVEFFKEVQVEWELGLALNQGQRLSIPFVVVGLFFIFRALYINKKKA